MILLRLLVLFLALAPGLAAASSVPSPAADDLISLDVKNTELEEVLRLLAEAGDVNLVLDPMAARARQVTARLQDVPWRQALDLIVRPHGLVAVLDGSVIRVAPASRLLQETQQEQRLAEAREQAGPLVTVAVPLSYADATTAARLVQPSLTTRGSVIVDRRTNTLVIRDVARGSSGAGATRQRDAPPGPDLRVRIELRAISRVRLPATARRSAGRAVPLPSAAARELLADSRLLAETELGMQVDDEVLLDLVPVKAELGGLATTALRLSPRRDGARLVLTVRDPARGSDRWWADADRLQVVSLPGDGAEAPLLVLRPL